MHYRAYIQQAMLRHGIVWAVARVIEILSNSKAKCLRKPITDDSD